MTDQILQIKTARNAIFTPYPDLKLILTLEIDVADLEVTSPGPDLVKGYTVHAGAARAIYNTPAPKLAKGYTVKSAPAKLEAEGQRISLFWAGNITLAVNSADLEADSPTPETVIGQSQILSIEPARLEVNAIPPDYRANLLDFIDRGDTIFLLVNGEHGEKLYQAYVRERTPQDRYLDITAVTGDGILAERIIKESYPEQDIGLTIKQFVDDYCSPLTTQNVNTETGIIAPVPTLHRRPIKVLEDLRKQYDINFFVDDTWDLHVYLNDEIEESKHTIRLGD